jgi:hypothetical protein
MTKAAKQFIANQIFVGLPWKNVKKTYDVVIIELEKKYPLRFSIVGRDNKQSAENLFDIIKAKISSSSYAIFDATVATQTSLWNLATPRGLMFRALSI